MNHLLIIDGLNLVRRLYAVQGTNCVTGGVIALRQIITHCQPTHAVVIFENPGQTQTWRHQLFADYKAGRPPIPADLVQQLPNIELAFSAQGVTCWQTDDQEADDVAATLAHKMALAGQQTTIVSTDKGFCQLLAPNIQIRDYFQKRWLDIEFIATEFGVEPAQLVDFWGLAGISSSKIPGVTGIGTKRAQQLITQFGSLEQLYQQLEQVPEKWRKQLQAQHAMALTCRRVATLQRDLQLKGNLAQLRYRVVNSY